MTWLSEPGRAKPLPSSTPTLRVAAGLAALSLAVAALPCAAQVVISSQGRGEVTVNGDVLDALGPPPTLPQLIDPRLAGSRTAPGLATPRVSQSDSVPRSRVYQLPPAPGAATPPPSAGYVPSVAAPPSVASNTPAPPRQAVVPAPMPSVAKPAAPTPSTTSNTPARTASAAPAPASVTASAPASIPPIPAERAAPRAPVASTPPPPPYTPPPAPAPVVRPAVVASAPPSPPPSLPPSLPPSAPSRAPSAAPPPSAAPAALASANASQVASTGALSRVLFAPGSADLSDDGKQALTQLATRLGRDADSRIQLLAYADGNAENESQARRLSLSRALAVRAYLIDQGVRSTRVNVQALGIKGAGGPPDRVDAMAATP